MIRYILILAIALFAGTANAQDIGIKIGDKMPDFPIGKLMGSPKNSIHTSAFKDQLLIIDFWATNCAGCVAALPKMEALQKQFGSKIKILPITYEPEIKVADFWKKNKYTKNLTLVSVVGDKVFAKYFKHQTIPHEIWVYKGEVIGITGSDYVDEKNIQRILNGEKMNWPVKNDFYVFDAGKFPLFNADPDQIDTSNTCMQYAAISDYKEGVNSEGLSGGSGIVRNAGKKNIRAYFLNQPIFTAYVLLFNKVIKPAALIRPGLINANEVVWEVKDRSRYIHRKTYGYLQDWLMKNAICFESLHPDTGQTDEQVYRNMISDLNALLGLNVRWERRKEKVWVLIRTKQRNQHKAEGKGDLFDLSDLIYRLNQQEENPYVFNESNSSEKVKLDVKSWTDIQSLKIALNALGYDLTVEEREVDKLVFSEINGGMLIHANMRTQVEAVKGDEKDVNKVVIPENWQNLDLKTDGVLGMSTEKAYAELLADKKAVTVPVAVIDGGIDLDHEDLKGSFWINKKEISGNKKDDDGNGYIDDIYGWNFMGWDKGSFIYDNIDLVRELRAALKLDPYAKNTKELQQQLNNRRRPLEQGFVIKERQRNALHHIVKQIGTPQPSIAQFKNYKYKNAEEADVLAIVVKGLKEDPDYMKSFEDEYNMYTDQLNYWTNINYNPRAGHPEFESNYYGNGDVKSQQPIHGTHIAGIIAANRNNGIGIKGVSAEALIMALRVIPEGEALDKDEANAILYAVNNGARVINISAGKSSSPNRALVDSAVRYAMKKDVLIIHAAGNTGSELEPATIFPCRQYLTGGEAEAWIEVGASGFIDDHNLVPWFSNYGAKTVDVFAPGLQIRSAWWPEKYATENGTSMAAPMVSGLAAIIRAYYPKLTALQIKEIIMKSVVKRDILKDKCISGGVVNAYQALKLASEY